ncbi:MAG: hypothetical protein KDI36_17800, partial [Pseudomonadales bacterium]|nr:hypothetical protein [Pseudomonadales bacterium]
QRQEEGYSGSCLNFFNGLTQEHSEGLIRQDQPFFLFAKIDCGVSVIPERFLRCKVCLPERPYINQR